MYMGNPTYATRVMDALEGVMYAYCLGIQVGQHHGSSFVTRSTEDPVVRCSRYDGATKLLTIVSTRHHEICVPTERSGQIVQQFARVTNA